MKANDDEWIDRWKEARRTDVPPTPELLTDGVMNRLGEEPKPESDRSLSPLLWIVRLSLVLLASLLMAGRLIATAAVFFTSTPLQ